MKGTDLKGSWPRVRVGVAVFGGRGVVQIKQAAQFSFSACLCLAISLHLLFFGGALWEGFEDAAGRGLQKDDEGHFVLLQLDFQPSCTLRFVFFLLSLLL